MKRRPFWINKIQHAWKKRSIVWLSGVRRVGKTTLAKMFDEVHYLNCDLPSVTRALDDPESFYENIDKNSIVIFDEVHRIENPSRLLKIAADVYPHLRILATGSSTLAATQKFRDSLTGRKHVIYLPPILWDECQDVFNVIDFDHRLFHGGLPEPLLAAEKDPVFFSEWIDSFYARDIQELFSIRNRTGFIKLLHLLLRQSGGQNDYSNLAKLSDLSRPSVKAHIEAMCVAHASFCCRLFMAAVDAKSRNNPNATALTPVLSPSSKVGIRFAKMIADFYGNISYWMLCEPTSLQTTCIIGAISPDAKLILSKNRSRWFTWLNSKSTPINSIQNHCTHSGRCIRRVRIM